MDKRSLFHAFLLAALFFGANYYFEQRNSTWRAQHYSELRAKREESPVEKEPAPPVLTATEQPTNSPLYVLENRDMQVVFSATGGAIAEVNLLQQNEERPSNPVREIEFDRTISSTYPERAHFPAHSAWEAKEGRVLRHPEGPGGYYPLLRRQQEENNPSLFAANIVSDYPEMASLPYSVVELGDSRIVLEAKQPHRTIRKTFTLEENYVINLEIEVEGESRGLWLTSGVPDIEMVGTAPANAIKLHTYRGESSQIQSLSLPKKAAAVSDVSPDWVCNANGFFGIIVDPLTTIGSGYRIQKVGTDMLPSRLQLLGESSPAKPAALAGYQVLLPLPASGGTMRFRLYTGPMSESALSRVDTTYSDKATGYSPNYLACQNSSSYFRAIAFVAEPFSKFLFTLMKFFHGVTGSWGISIILLTVALRVMLYPLNSWSMRSSARMQKLAPEIQALQERYKKEPKKAQMETFNLYRERKVNPFSGCVPMLIQLPFLLGMFELLKSTFELRGAVWIPGWIDNLASPDVIYQWGYSFPVIGNQLHLLPMLVGLSMYLQQWLTMPKGDANAMTDQQRQQRAMATMMPIMFTLLFYNFPAGLNLYWLSSTLLGIAQQWWIQRAIAKASPKETPPTSRRGKKGRPARRDEVITIA